MWFWQVPFFPLHVVPWPFWSRNVKSFWQKQRFGWAWERKTATDFSLEERQKKTLLKHTRFLARWWWEMRAGNKSLSLAILVSWGYTCAFLCFCGNTGNELAHPLKQSWIHGPRHTLSFCTPLSLMPKFSKLDSSSELQWHEVVLLVCLPMT